MIRFILIDLRHDCITRFRDSEGLEIFLHEKPYPEFLIIDLKTERVISPCRLNCTISSFYAHVDSSEKDSEKYFKEMFTR